MATNVERMFKTLVLESIANLRGAGKNAGCTKRRAGLLLSLVFASCSGPSPAPPQASSPPGRFALADLPDVDAAAVLAHTKTLASDAFEGRAPGSRGETKSVAYIVDQFKKMGLTVGNTDGSFTQKVPLVGITAAGAPLVAQERRGDHSPEVEGRVWSAGRSTSRRRASLNNSELVFVGYGVVAPEFNWDDYKGVDVKGKTLVMLVNDPPVPDPVEAARSSIPKSSAARR